MVIGAGARMGKSSDPSQPTEPDYAVMHAKTNSVSVKQSQGPSNPNVNPLLVPNSP